MIRPPCFALALLAVAATAASPPVTFRKQVLSTEYLCDGINAADFNRDGQPDIVAGPYWYEAPSFRTKHAFYPPVPLDPGKSPSDSMYSYVHDFNADGWPDILVLGRVHLHQAFWYENPRGEAGFWKKHFVFHRVQGESPPFADVDGDGRPELVALWEKRWGLIQPDPADAAKPWRFRPITEDGDWHHFYHGTGVGDVNGDGRLDLILNDGWWEQPARLSDAPWKAHPYRFAPKGGAQMFACDVDGDGDSDILTALDAHGWGLAWFEQVREDGEIRFKQRDMMGSRSEQGRYAATFSQPHALELADLDGDGLKDLIVGKRRWAHGPTGDVEPDGEPVIYWFRLVRENGTARFAAHRIDNESGAGVQITAADVTRDGRPDVLTVSKLGAFLFVNTPPAAR
jgi:hypothetical protein